MCTTVVGVSNVILLENTFAPTKPFLLHDLYFIEKVLLVGFGNSGHPRVLRILPVLYSGLFINHLLKKMSACTLKFFFFHSMNRNIIKEALLDTLMHIKAI